MKIFLKILKFWENTKIRWMIVADAPQKRVTIFVVFNRLSQLSRVQRHCPLVKNNPEIEGSNLADGAGREKFATKITFKLS